ncbi:MAG: thioredoxin-disulfide reductase [Bacteroidaceae bacterium]
MNKQEIIIIGSGPAGYSAAIYLGRSGYTPIIIEGLQPGGQLTTTTTIENYPGFPNGIDANELMDNMRQQAINYGAIIKTESVVYSDLSKQPYILNLDNEEKIIAETIIIATGATAKYLGLEDENKYKGVGVSACATCDGFFYRKKIVAVVGGGDTACEEASYLSRIATKVYLIVRKPQLRASKVMQERVFNNPKIEILFETNTIGLFGNNKLEGATLVFRKGLPDEKTYNLTIDGFFLAIGHKPNSDIFKPWIKTNDEGYIITNCPTTQTNLPGIFAAGDVADPIYRQAINAAASGCKAAMDTEKYITNNL